MARVLFADDDPDMRALASELLGQRGHDVVTAGDGAEAIAILDEMTPSLVITDLNMPGQDGFDVCVAVRRSPALRHIPLILITALPFDDVRVVRISSDTNAIVIAKTDITMLADLTDRLTSAA